MQKQRPAYIQMVQKSDAQLGEFLGTGLDLIMTDGALPAKVKTLMTLVCDALLAHDEGVKSIADRARGMGVTEDEIIETVRVAFWMGGVPALVSGSAAFKE